MNLEVHLSYPAGRAAGRGSSVGRRSSAYAGRPTAGRAGVGHVVRERHPARRPCMGASKPVARAMGTCTTPTPPGATSDASVAKIGSPCRGGMCWRTMNEFTRSNRARAVPAGPRRGARRCERRAHRSCGAPPRASRRQRRRRRRARRAGRMEPASGRRRSRGRASSAERTSGTTCRRTRFREPRDDVLLTGGEKALECRLVEVRRAGTPRPRRRRSTGPCGRTAPTAARGRARRVVLACARVIHVALNLVFLVPGETGGMEVYARELIPRLAGGADLRLTALVNREAAGEDFGIEQMVVPVQREAAHGVGARRAAARAPHGSRGRRGPRPLARQHGAAVGQRAASHDDPRPQLQARPGGPLRPPRPRDAGARPGGGAPLAADHRRRRIDAPGSARASGHRRRARSTSCRSASPPSRPSIRRRRTPLRERLGIGDRPVVLSVSAKRPHKNLERLLRAVAAIPPSADPRWWCRATRRRTRRSCATSPPSCSSTSLLPQWVSSAELEGLYAMATLCRVPVAVRGLRASRARGHGARRAGRMLGPLLAAGGGRRRCAAVRPDRRGRYPDRRSSDCSRDAALRDRLARRRSNASSAASRGRPPPSDARRLPPRLRGRLTCALCSGTGRGA